MRNNFCLLEKDEQILLSCQQSFKKNQYNTHDLDVKLQ